MSIKNNFEILSTTINLLLFISNVSFGLDLISDLE